MLKQSGCQESKTTWCKVRFYHGGIIATLTQILVCHSPGVRYETDSDQEGNMCVVILT